ncbi:hypothetical protein KMB83_gp50 [Ralstonia phage Anchaing]|uniref:Uncharacterized protein n=1 Tax=Ralstonia phage Anchaing TaxID=2759719 RepID=A0A7G5B8E7_9CAUD|nr:hypothetical protein KMB83_gp50 [Ralstonia phage Anchaing]QMV32570.1 hypothetical protein A1_00050 [Ralstonia phage Anchaing]
MKQAFPNEMLRVRAVCIDASGTGNDLTHGEEYEVEPAPGCDDRLWVYKGTKCLGLWLESRFRVVTPPAPSLDLLAALTGKPLKFRSGCPVKFVAYVPEAKPHCQLVLLNPATGNVVTRYANGKSSEEPYDEPGDILVA